MGINARSRTLGCLLLCMGFAGSGCAAQVQRDIGSTSAADSGAGMGRVVGSVSAPPAGHYHHQVVFHYRGRGPVADRRGVLTSASTLPFQPFVPACHEHGLPGECARLFALELPAGDYVIYRVTVADAGGGTARDLPGWSFSVEPGEVSYLGNLHMQYCQGLVRRTRGGILGGEAAVRDRLERDLPLLQARFPQLVPVAVHTRLPDAEVFTWRVSYLPYDWGSCSGGISQP